MIAKLKLLQSVAISNASSLRVALNCGSESALTNERLLNRFLTSLPARINSSALSTKVPPTTFTRNAKTFFPLPYQVYYSGIALRTAPYTAPESAPLQVLAQLLTHKHLHHEIREKGGAYGGGSFATPLGGIFGFYSYRDPNPVNMMKIVKEVGEWAVNRTWTDRDIEEAKLSVFQGLDAPQSVSEEGMTQFLAGVGYEMQQARRERLLDVKAEDVKEVAERFLVQGAGERATTVLGARKEWVKEAEGWSVKDLGALSEAPVEVVEEEAPVAAAAA